MKTMTNEEQLAQVKLLEAQLEKTFPDYTWEDRAMWMQTPKDFLFSKTPLQICATDEIGPLIQWLKDRTP